MIPSQRRRLLLFVFDGGVPCTSNKSKEDTERVDEAQMEIEDQYGEENRQDLFDVSYRGKDTVWVLLILHARNRNMVHNSPATVIVNAPAL